MLRDEPEDIWLSLMRAHCFIVNKQRQEGLWIIQDLKRDIKDKSSVEWAYLLYLCTLIERQEDYVNRLTKEIEVIFRRHEDDPRIFWFLSFLRKEYVGDHSRKLQAVMRWIDAGYHSPFLLIEAYAVLLQDPYMLYEFSERNLKILYWAARRDQITRDIAMQVFHIIEKLNVFTEKIWFIIQKAYKAYEDEDFFAAIVSYLLRNQRFEEHFITWYEKAIEADLRLSGLYEAYMLCLPTDSIDKIPFKVSLYFCYSCNLPYEKKALLYANIILHRKDTPQLYEQCLRSIENFALEQMKLNRVDDNLAIIYQNVLEMGVVDETMAKEVAGTIFMKKLVCLYPDITRVFVYQEQYEFPMVVPVVDGIAYVPIVSEHFQVFLETRWGGLVTDKGGYTLQRIMYPEAYLARLKNLAPLSLSFILSDFDKKRDTESFTVEDLGKMDTFLHSTLVSKSYIRSRYPAIISLLQRYTREELLEEHFTHEVDFSSVDAETMTYIITSFLRSQQYERAYELMAEYNGLEADHKLLLDMCNELIIARNFAKDELLLALSAYLVYENLATAATTTYLSDNQVGETPWMLRLWQLAKEQKLHVVDLEENILFQGLYAESMLSEIMPVFESYMSRGKDKMLMEAYMNYWAHEYMLAHEGVPESFFTILAYYFDREYIMKESCNLAYMKFLSTVKLLSDREYEILDKLLQQYILRNVYFSFYRNFDKRLLIKYHLYDKYFVEYRGNPGEQITISYHIDEQLAREEEMIEIYEGIFVKQFVLFFGETLSYELFSENVPDLPVCADSVVVSSHLLEGREDRYDLINRMQNELVYSEQQNLAKDLKLYQGLDAVTNTLFTTV